MNEVLLLGSQGMLGNMLAQTFSDRHLLAWDRNELDITNQQAVQEKIFSIHPAIIINAAAYTDVDGAETNKNTAMAVNAQAVRNIAEVAKNIDAILIHYSTDYVFPGTKDGGYVESDVPGPAVNAYGESKLAGEQALQQINPKYYLLRTAWLYGPGGKNFVDTMLRVAEEKPEIKVVNDQFGSPTFTKDVAQVTRFLIDGSYEYGVYHAVNNGMVNWYDFAKKIFELSHKGNKVVPISSSEYPLPAKRPKNSALHNTKGPKLRSWQEALHDYLGPMDRKTYIT